MCERRSHCNFPSKMDYQCKSDFGYGRRKHHHRHHCNKQFWSEPERTWTGERLHHGRPQPFSEFEKQNHHHHHHHQMFGRPEQFEGHHNHYQMFSPFQQFSKPEGCKFNRHHFHQQCQFPFYYERRCHQPCWTFARPEKFEKHHKHHCHQQFSPCERLGKCPQFKRPETCEKLHPPFKQFWSFNGPCQFERHRNCYSQWQQFWPFQPFGKPCQFEGSHKHHCHQQFSPCERLGKCPQFKRPETCERRHPPFKQFWSFNGPCQFERHRKCHLSCKQFGPFQPFERNHKHHCYPKFSPCGSFNQCPEFIRPKICQRHCHHHCGRFGPRSSFENFDQLANHHYQFRTYPSFSLFKYQKHCKRCRRTCPSSLFRRRFCGSKFGEDSSLSRIHRIMIRKQLGRYPIKHHFHHHKSHRFHHHRSHRNI